MAVKQFYCKSCKCWIQRDSDEPTLGARKQHAKFCNGDPFANHPDLQDLELELEFYFGET